MSKASGMAVTDLAERNRQQAERIAELEKKITNLHTTMFAAAMEIQEHWDAHCDADGYGPINLVNRLEKGIAAQYGYDAETLHRAYNQIDELQGKVNSQRAKTDALMLEYCPAEMTQEQISEWARHQRVVKIGEI